MKGPKIPSMAIEADHSLLEETVKKGYQKVPVSGLQGD